MKTRFLFLLLLVTASLNTLKAQTILDSCLTDSLPILTISSQWTITSNSLSQPTNVPSTQCTYQYLDLPSFPTAKWISCIPSWTIFTNIADPDDSISFRKDFRLCQYDTVNLKITVKRDNYCTVYLDGLILLKDSAVWNTVYYDTGTLIDTILYLNQGVHHIDITDYNRNAFTGTNGFGLLVGGFMKANNNSIIRDSSACANVSCCIVAPPLQITGDTLLCQGDATILTASGANTYSWSSGITNGVSFTPGASSTYTVTGTDANGCTNTTTIGINVLPAPLVNANASPSTVCQNSPTTLTGSGALSYTWNGGITNGVPIIPTSTTAYTVTGTDANGCTNTSTVTVNVGANLFIGVVPDQPILCLGDSIQLTASGAISYTWVPNVNINSTAISDPLIYPTSTATYTVTGTDATGCTGTSSVTIEVISDPKLLVSKSGDVECNIHTVQLSVSGASAYTWSPAIGLSAPNAAVTNAIVNEPTTFIVVGIVGSCIVTDSIHVDVYNNDETAMYIPNAFTPNGDGNNDCLRVLNSANFKDYYFAIYNRWGQRVFETDSPFDCWDGTFKNQRVESSTYYYFLKGETRCGKVFKKGDITVVY